MYFNGIKAEDMPEVRMNAFIIKAVARRTLKKNP